jgi:hypothetical protein
MALSQALEEYLGKLGEDTQKILRPIVEQNPELGEGWLRQDDYSRKSAELQTKSAEAEKGLAKAAEWKNWWDESKPAYDKTLSENQRLREENAAAVASQKTLNDRLERALKDGGDVDPELLKANVNTRIDEEFRTRGFVTQDKLKEIVATESKALFDNALKTTLDTERKTFMEQTLPATVYFNQTLMDIREEYKDEFGERLDRSALSKFMEEQKVTDPRKAYDQWIAPRRTELQAKKAREEGIAEGRKDALSKMNLPGSGVTPQPDIGHMEARFRAASAVPTTTREGAAAAAAELVAEGKF